MKEWSQETFDTLRAWLGRNTAYKEHPLDDIRFYVFLGRVWIDIHGLWDESLVRERITKEAKELHPDWADDCIKDLASKRCSQGTLILDFLSRIEEKGLIADLAKK